MSSVNRKCPGCRRKMKLTARTALTKNRRAAVYYCPFCINLSKKVMQKINELEKAEKEVLIEQD